MDRLESEANVRRDSEEIAAAAAAAAAGAGGVEKVEMLAAGKAVRLGSTEGMIGRESRRH